MRCTKCGYISFDYLQSCSKCSTDLQEVSSLLKGTAVQSQPHYYLRLLLEPSDEKAPHVEVEEEELLLSEEGEGAEEAVLDLQGEDTGVEAATEDLEPSLTVKAEEGLEIEMPAAALGADLEEAAAPVSEVEEEAGGIELSLDVAEEEPPAEEGVVALGTSDEDDIELEMRSEEASADEQQMPEGLELKDISAPGENITAGLEEIDLNDLMVTEGEEGEEEELALEEKINDEEVEKIFDLSDILSEDDDELKQEEEEARQEVKAEAEGAKKEKAALTDLDLELDLDLDE